LIYIIDLFILVSKCSTVPAPGCPLGTARTNGSCLPCSPGTYSNDTNLTQCYSCSVGKYSDSIGRSLCYDCEQGLFQNNVGKSACANCSGQLTSSQGSGSCPVVQQCSGFSILPGTTRAFKVLSLSKLMNHWEARAYVRSQLHYSDLASVDSIEVKKILVADSNFNPSQSTWVGLYHDDALFFRWYLNGTTQNLSWCTGYPDSSSNSQRHGAVVTGSGCLQDAVRSSTFLYVAVEIDVSRCGSFCSPGTMVDTNSSSCLTCPSGKYSKAYGESSCQSCPVGQFSPVDGASVCSQCDDGKFASSMESSVCSNCPTGAWTRSSSGASAVSECHCQADWYGEAFLGLSCTKCDQPFQKCVENSTKPFILPGFWLDSNLNKVYACDPPSSCVSTGFADQTICGAGYTGRKCGLCISMRYFRLNGECRSCANEAVKWLFFVFLIILLCYSLLRVSKMKGLRIPYDVRVAYSWMQMISLFPVLFSSWPQKLLNMLRLLSFTNLDLDLVSPGKIFFLILVSLIVSTECSMTLTFWPKFFLKLSSPFILISFCGVLMLVDFLWMKSRKSHEVFEAYSIAFVRACVVILSLSYTYMVVEVTKPFNCTKELDGSFSLGASPDVRCYDQEWKNMLPGVSFFLVLYVIILPGLLLSLFIRYRTSLNDQWFKVRFGVLVSYFKPRFFYWEMVLLFKKTCFSLATNVFASFMSILTRYFTILSFLFVFLMIEVLTLPYSSTYGNQVNQMYVTFLLSRPYLTFVTFQVVYHLHNPSGLQCCGILIRISFCE
jgi:hypothetical protein